MAGKIKGITITLGADVQPLNKALEDVNKKSRDLQGELRQVERLLKLDPKNTELLAQKQKLLAEAVENSREKLDRLRTAQEQVNEQFRKGEINEEQYRAFQREVIKAEQELKSFEKQLRDTGITAEQVGKKMQDVGEKMTGIGKTMSTYVTAPIVAAGAASFKMAADLQDALGATDQIFKSAANSVKQWADNLESYYGITEKEALEYANMMGSLLQNIGGLTEEEAAKQAQTLVQLAGDLTAMYGGTTADAVRALTGALKGNNTMLDNYGMAVNDALIKTKALEMGLIGEKEQLTLAAKQAATLALIMEQSGAAQGQAAREAEGASGSMRAFSTELKNLATDIGEILLPIITPFLQSLRDIVKSFSELSPTAQKVILVIAGIAAAIGPLLIVIGTLISSIGTITTFFAAGGAGATAFGAVIAALTGPIGIAIAAITALIAVGVLLYKNWDEIKAYANELLKTLKQRFEDIKTAISNAWETVKTKTREAFNSIVDTIKNTLMGLISALREIGSNIVNGLWEGIQARISWLKDKIAGFVQGITDSVKGVLGIRSPSKVFAEIGENVSLGLAKGIEEAKSAVENALTGLMEPQLNVGLAGASPAGMGAITNTFVIQNMNIRSDQDIKLIAKELHNLQRQSARGRGMR